MLGEIICDAKNVFSGQQFSSPDHIMIYKGLQIWIFFMETLLYTKIIIIVVAVILLHMLLQW